MSPGRPLRPETWCQLLEEGGYEAAAQLGPGGADFLVHAVRSSVTVPSAAGAVNAAAGRPVAVHQFIPALNPHDATGTHTLKLRDTLRAAGWRSEIFAEAIPGRPGFRGLQTLDVPGHTGEVDVAIYQFTTSSAVAGYLAEHGLPLILDFHNFTGPEYFAGWEDPRHLSARRGRPRSWSCWRRRRCSGWPAAFSERALRRAGCRRTAVVPVLADYGHVTAPPDPRVAAELAGLAAGGGADILFVGRIVPSKEQHELVKTLWAYRRLYDDRARLHLVGGTSSFEYNKVLQDFHRDLGLSSAVRLTGEVSDAALAAYFGAADVYLSFSAHEGFGVPLVEAMVAGVPVVARGAGAVAETVAGAALVLAAADPSYVAAALHRACTDDRLPRHVDGGGTPQSGAALGRYGRWAIVGAVAGVVSR